MKCTGICPVCKGTGYESHKYIRNDGEEATESISCELCNGNGSIGSNKEKSSCIVEFAVEIDQTKTMPSVFELCGFDIDKFL